MGHHTCGLFYNEISMKLHTIMFIIPVDVIKLYKSQVNQKPGWHDEIITWEAERQNLKVHDYINMPFTKYATPVFKISMTLYSS